jgi:chromosome segregation ATPase
MDEQNKEVLVLDVEPDHYEWFLKKHHNLVHIPTFKISLASWQAANKQAENDALNKETMDYGLTITDETIDKPYLEQIESLQEKLNESEKLVKYLEGLNYRLGEKFEPLREELEQLKNENKKLKQDIADWNDDFTV